MRNRILAAPLVLFVIAGCGAGSNPAVDAAAERSAVEARLQALVTVEKEIATHVTPENAKAAAAFYAADAIVQPAGTPAMSGRSAVEAFYNSMKDTGITGFETSQTSLSVSASGDMAWQTGTNTFRMGSVTSVGKYLAVWKKVGTEWQVAGISFSDDAPPPAAASTGSPTPAVKPAR